MRSDPAFDITSDPSLHDISRGTTGCGDDDDDEWFVNASDSLTAVADAFTIEREHVHDYSCNGTLELGETRLCGF